MPVKKQNEIKRIYFIAPINDIKNITEILMKDKPDFIDKIYCSKINDNNFINIVLNIELDENTFFKLAEKFNKKIEGQFKMFYKDPINKFIYVDKLIKDNIKSSLNMFINDD
jgi:hypothetical protein